MKNTKTMILCAAALSLTVLGTSNLNTFAQIQGLDNKINQANNGTKTQNIKNLVNNKEYQDLNKQNFENNEIAVRNNVYTAKVARYQTEIDDLINQQKYEEARLRCLETLKANPNDHKTRINLGSIYSAQYKLGAAHSEFIKVLEKDPNNAAARNGLGLIYYRKTSSSNMEIRKNLDKYYKGALKEFEAAIKLQPDFYKAYNNAGKILQEMGKIDEAEQYYRKALEYEPKYSEALENLGTTLYVKNQVDPAIDKFKSAIESSTKNASAYYHLGEALISKGEYSKAINYLQTALYLSPNSAPVHDMLGKAYQLQGNEAAAIVEYKKSCLIKPEYSYPYLRLANIYQDRGDYELAISELRSALSTNPDFLEGKLKVAEISLTLGKPEQAIRYYREVLGNRNYSQVALKGLAKSYYMKAQEASSTAGMISESEYVDAESAIKQAIQFNPDDIQLYLALLRVSRLTNQDSQAEAYLSKIVENPANKPIDHIIKGEAYLTYKKYTDANNEFKQAMYQVSSIKDLMNLGEIFITNRQYPVAKETFNKILSMDSGNLKAMRALERIQRNEELAVAKMNVAKGFYNTRQRAAAIEAFRDSISLNPYLAEAQLLLAKTFEKEKYYFNAIEHYTAYINLANTEGKDTDKYKRKIAKLNEKVQRMQEKGQPIKKFTRI
ncbi:MAG: hypothetical protein A2255_03965 [Candidatus Melainabacteria bacterium RIFOXYA2_FULL_32_9]|nr:MAG: hypothetical protein A2255_03965 [Candidatus Melainabacteria bacterium RIFOXYA2_FULL_32_9]